MTVPTTLSTWDYVSLSITLVISTFVGFYQVFKGKKSRDTKEFLVAERNIGFFPVVLSTIATAISPIAMQAFPLEMYVSGIQFVLTTVGPFLTMPVFAYIFLPVYYNLGISSVFQYLEFRYNRLLRIVSSLMCTIQMVVYTSCVIYAPSLALNQVTGLDLWGSVLSIGVVCIIYTALGGIKAVIWADVVQLIILVFAIVVVLIKGCMDGGGIAEIYEVVKQSDRLAFHIGTNAMILPLHSVTPRPDIRDTIWSCLIGSSIHFLAFMSVSQMHIQRFLSNPTISRAIKSFLYATFGVTIILIICFLTGFVMYAKYHDCDPYLTGAVSARDQMVPLFAVETLQFAQGLSGIYVAGVLCASLSTLSSVLNSLSAVTLTDYIKPLFPHLSDQKAKTLSKILAAVYGVLCIGCVGIAARMGGILRALYIIGGAVGGPLFTIFVLGVLFPWTTARGAMAGFVASFSVGCWCAIGSLLNQHSLPIASVSVDGCNASTPITSNHTLFTLTNSNYTSNFTEHYVDAEPVIEYPTSEVFFLYTLSPLWYSALNGAIGMVVGLAVSIATGAQDPEEIDERLISPAIESLYRSFPEKIRLFLGYKSEKVKPRRWNTKMEHKTEANMEYASIPLKEKENEVCNLEQGTLNKEELQNGIH